MDLLYTLSGFVVGAIVGLTGVGGGSLMTPLLVLLFGVPPATAVGTDLLYAAVTKAGGTVVHAKKGHVQWRITGLLAAGSILQSPRSVPARWVLPRSSTYLYPHLPALRVIGGDVAHAVPLTLVAGIGHWLIGSVNWPLLSSLLLGSLPGIWVGSHASGKVPERFLRPILASMLVLVGGKLIAL
jgi:uncharacterized membrane protein YfcA